MQKLSKKDKVIAAIIAALLAGGAAGICSWFGIGYEEEPKQETKTEQVEIAE